MIFSRFFFFVYAPHPEIVLIKKIHSRISRHIQQKKRSWNLFHLLFLDFITNGREKTKKKRLDLIGYDENQNSNQNIHHINKL